MEWVELGNYITQIRGVSYNKSNSSDVNKEGYIPILKANNIQDGKLIFNGYTYVSSDKVKNEQLIKKGDIIIATSSGSKHVVGKAAQAKEDMGVSFGAFCKLIRVNECISNDYLGHFFQSKYYRYNISSLSEGANIYNLKNEHFDNIKIYLPSMPIQQKIVEVLDKAQRLIDNRKYQIELLDKLIESIFYDMFGDPVKNEKGWEVDKLKNNINLLGGYAFKSKEYKDKGVPVIKIGNINRGYFEDKNLQFYDEQKSLERYLLKSGDLVMSLTGTVGKDDYGNVCILGDEYDKYYLNQRNTKIDVLNKLDKIYLKYIFKDNGVRANLTKANRGVRQANISNDDIYGLIIPIPPLSLQNQFALKVESIEKQKQLLQDSLKIMEDNYNMLMQRAFKGELFN